MLIRFKDSEMVSLLMAVLLSVAASQSNQQDATPSQRRKRTSDPVSNFFSELGDLILDVDQTIAVQSQPKIEHEANVMSQLFRPPSDYFDRIQKNYKDMQKRLGNLIGNTIGFKNTYSDHELSTVSPPLEDVVATMKPDYNPFAAAAEARKEKLKQRISKGSTEPKISIPKTIDESLKAFSKLSKAVIDDIEDFSKRKPSKSSNDKTTAPEKRTGSIDISEECSNEVLEDPDLERRRQEKCSRIAAEERIREDLRKLMLEPKRATEALFSKSAEALDKLAKPVSRSGDISVDITEECSNEVLQDPDLERRRQEKCSRIAAEERIREDLRKLMLEPKRATETLFSKTAEAMGKFAKPVSRSGDITEECSNEVLEDPDLEKRRQEKCSRLAAEQRMREDLKKLILEPKRASEALFSKSAEALDRLAKPIFGRSGDMMEDKAAKESDSVLGDVSSDVSADECSNEALEDAALESIRKEKCNRLMVQEEFLKALNKLLKDPKRATKLIPAGSKAIDDLSSVFIKRSGESEDENGDSSDSSIDEQIRQLIKDHGSWILDYPLIKRWRQRDRSSDNESPDQTSEESEHTTLESTSDEIEIEPTEVYVPVSTDYEMALQKSGEAIPRHPHESSYYRIVNEDGDLVEEEVDFVLEPESLSSDIGTEREEQRETVILAFTSDGIPLKLRMGPEIDNPLQYLHKVLKSAGVSLNVPVESYDDLEPVGKEVLKLGSGILSRAVLINASNSNELKSLLKALMASKSSGKTNF